MKKQTKKQKVKFLKSRLKFYEEKLAKELIGYRGVIHESAVSEIKHDKVMLLRAMVDSIKAELKELEDKS